MATTRAEVIKRVARDAVHTLPVTVWAAMSFEDVRTRVRQVVGDASDAEVSEALTELEDAGLAYRRPQTEEERRRDPDGWYGPGQTAAYEIRELADPDGGLILQLVVEDQVTGTARASCDMLHDMNAMLGMGSEEVTKLLRKALREHMIRELEKVTISQIHQIPDHELHFAASYVYRDFDNIQTGAVWYDVPTGHTGPDSVPAVVKNLLRTKVHGELAVGGGAKQAS